MGRVLALVAVALVVPAARAGSEFRLIEREKPADAALSIDKLVDREMGYAGKLDAKTLKEARARTRKRYEVLRERGGIVWFLRVAAGSWGKETQKTILGDGGETRYTPNWETPSIAVSMANDQATIATYSFMPASETYLLTGYLDPLLKEVSSSPDGKSKTYEYEPAGFPNPERFSLTWADASHKKLRSAVIFELDRRKKRKFIDADWKELGRWTVLRAGGGDKPPVLEADYQLVSGGKKTRYIWTAPFADPKRPYDPLSHIAKGTFVNDIPLVKGQTATYEWKGQRPAAEAWIAQKEAEDKKKEGIDAANDDPTKLLGLGILVLVGIAGIVVFVHQRTVKNT